MKDYNPKTETNGIYVRGNTLGIPYTTSSYVYYTCDLDSSIFHYHFDSENRLIHETHNAPIPESGEIEIFSTLVGNGELRSVMYTLIFKDDKVVEAVKKSDDIVLNL